jgi:ribose transport system substrate-binding protein
MRRFCLSSLRLARLAAVLGLSLAAAACNSSADRGAPQSAAGSADGKPRLAFISNNPFEFWTIARRGTEKAAQDFDAEVDFQMPARGTAAEQKQIIEDLVARGIQGIAISPNDSANQADFLNEIAEQVPVIAVDSDLPPGSKRLAYIGTNNYEAGKSAGKLVKEALPDGGEIVIYVGKMDVQNAIERRQGVMDELAGKKDAKGPELGKYTLLDTMTDDADQARCKDNVEDTLVKYPDVDGLVGLWAYNPPAILAAVKEADKQGKVAIIAFDEDEATLGGVKEGHIHGTIVQQPFEFGYQSMRLLAALARNDKSVLPEGGVLEIPHKVINKENVEEFQQELRALKGQ